MLQLRLHRRRAPAAPAAASTSATVAYGASCASVVIVGGSILRSPRCATSIAAPTGTHDAALDSLVTSSASAPSGSAPTKNRVS